MIAVRRMQISDLSQVADIEKASFSTPWSEKALKESMQNPNYVFCVACVDEEVVGYCGLYVVLDEGQITNIAVKKEFRNRRIGTALLMKIMEYARVQGAYNFSLDVRVSNESAVHLYEKIGFKSVGIRKKFYDKPVEDAYVMWLFAKGGITE